MGESELFATFRLCVNISQPLVTTQICQEKEIPNGSLMSKTSFESFSESELLYYRRKLSRLRGAGQQLIQLCDSTHMVSRAESEELDLVVLSLVSDLGDLQQQLGWVPASAPKEATRASEGEWGQGALVSLSTCILDVAANV